MSKDPESCPDCPDQGWYGIFRGHGNDEQVQCEFCWSNPNSVFNLMMELDEIQSKLQDIASGKVPPIRFITVSDIKKTFAKYWRKCMGCPMVND